MPAAVASATAPAIGVTINYRSIGTDTGVYSTGDASIAAGTSVVTFAGGASLPAGAGLGDRLVIRGGAIGTHETVTGWSGGATPVTMPAIPGGDGQTYVLFVATEDNRAVNSVTGGGMPWTLQVQQCAAASSCGFYIYTAQGSPGGPFQVQIDYESGKDLSAVLSRYSGVAAFESAVGENTNGVGGACTGSPGTDPAQLTLASTYDGSIHAIGVCSLKKNVDSVSPGYASAGSVTSGNVWTWAYTKTFSPAGAEQMQATLSGIEKWATVGIVLNPGYRFDVLAVDSTTQATVQESAPATIANGPYELARSYNTMQAWEDDRQGDLVADDRREVGVCYDDGDFTDQLTISGSTTDPTRFMRLTVAEDSRHLGVGNTGARIDAGGGWAGGDAITVEDEYTRIEWLEIANVHDAGNGIVLAASPASDGSTVSHVLGHSFWQNGNAYVRTAAPNTTVRNSFFNGGASYAILVATGCTLATIENCSILGDPLSGAGISDQAGTTTSVINTISVGHAAGQDIVLSSTVAAFANNMYSGVTGFSPAAFGGGNKTPPADLEDLFIDATTGGTPDLHLEASGHDALDNGLDLAATRGFGTDIDGETRFHDWDIGADELQIDPLQVSYRSIGAAAGVLYSTGTATIAAGDTLVSFSGATIPANVGVGDELVIGTTTFHVAYRDSDTQVRVDEAPAMFGLAGRSFTFRRAYATLQDWHDGRGGNLAAEKRQEWGVAYDDAAFTGPLVATATSATPSSMILTVAQGQRHNGIAGAGARIDAGGISGQAVIRATVPFEVEWLEITDFRDGAHGAIEFAGAAGESRAEFLLVHDFDSGAAAAIRADGADLVRNSMIFDGIGCGIRATNASSLTVHNCTVYNVSLVGVRADVLTVADVRNTIAVDCLGSDFDLGGTITYFGNNMFSTYLTFDPADYQGGNQSPPADLDDLFISIFPGTEDLHLEAAGHNAGNKGQDLSSLFTGDIDGVDRTGAYDIGADEAISGGYQVRIISWREVDPYY